MTRFVFAMSLLACVAITACAPKNVAFRLPVDRYDEAFVTAREELRRRGFDLERVDARAGVISTKPLPSAGLATPWVQVQSEPIQLWSDFMNRNQRVARVTFARMDDEAPPLEDEALVETDPEALTCRVEVIVERSYRPGLRVESSSIRLSTYTIDPDEVVRGMRPRYTVPIERDDRLAARIATSVAEKLELPTE